MRPFTLVFASLIIVLTLITLIWKPQERLIWNRTASAPLGLYWLNDGPYAIGEWAIVSAKSDAGVWSASHGYTSQDWPLIKRVAGLSGDEICRHGADIVINGEGVASAMTADEKGRPLPVWDGCVLLTDDQVFLLNAHPDSLDGRYFGPTNIGDLVGKARKVDLF